MENKNKQTKLREEIDPFEKWPLLIYIFSKFHSSKEIKHAKERKYLNKDSVKELGQKIDYFKSYCSAKCVNDTTARLVSVDQKIWYIYL